MFLRELNVSNFRNYDNISMNLSQNVNIFCGNNAQGKTNLLEAIYFLGLTKSHRCQNQEDLIKRDKDFSNVSGILKIDDNTLELFIGFDKSKKNLKINNQGIKKIRDYISNMNLIIFCPDDLEIIKGLPEVRRRFLNTEISQISTSYAKVLEDYNKLLRMRNDYLNDSSNFFDDTYYDILTGYLIDRAISVYKYRKNFIDKLNKIVGNIYCQVAGYESFNIKYMPSIDINYSSSEVKEIISDMYKEIKIEEKRLKKTLLGPHRDDFEFLLSDNNLKIYGSQGQQRMAVISLKLAEISIIKDIKKTTPIILLDDVFSELDDKKKNSLLEYILGDIQVIITTTDLNNLNENLLKNAKIMYITNGNLEEVKEDGRKQSNI